MLSSLTGGLSEVKGLFVIVVNMQVALIISAYFGAYLAINIGRRLKGRVKADYLRKIFWASNFWLTGLIAATLLISVIILALGLSTVQVLSILAALQLLCSLGVLSSAIRHIKTTRPPQLDGHYSDAELPSISVCIPARNETDELNDCLRSLTASTYPKLEILVLDDCSQNKRTPEIIRDFAQSGVRFIAGGIPPESWLAKNYAYSQLADEASGEILIFAGVDSRFGPDSLANMVSLFLQKKKSMVSFLPQNIMPSNGFRALLVQPARYAWELALPRRFFNRPPVLSSCWMISKPALSAYGGFAGVKRKVVPESYLAKSATRHDDGYSFIVSDSQIGLLSNKGFEEQRNTAVRTRYPQLHKRPEIAALTGLGELFVLLAPLAFTVQALFSEQYFMAGISAAAYFIQSYVYGRIASLSYRRFLPLGYVILPVAAIYDLVLLNYSMWQYEFGEVLWKGRNVCLPVMQVVARLPKT